MTSVVITLKFQVRIPKEIRSALCLMPGQRMQVRLVEDKVEFVPEKTVASLSGRWPGVDAQIVRDADRFTSN